MTIPKYVQELMARSSFDVFHHPRRDPGYTIRIRKATPYTTAATLRKECERLVVWANRQPSGPDTAILLDCPAETHHVWQCATVTIYDPVMKHLEQYIEKENRI